MLLYSVYTQCTPLNSSAWRAGCRRGVYQAGRYEFAGACGGDDRGDRAESVRTQAGSRVFSRQYDHLHPATVDLPRLSPNHSSNQPTVVLKLRAHRIQLKYILAYAAHLCFRTVVTVSGSV
eukprot:COSAG02_NODE_1864_length_10606_cov_17.350148_12_plen_121_part_00